MMVYKPPYLFALLFIKTTLSVCPSELLGQEVTELVKLRLSYRASITLIQGYEWDSLLVFFFLGWNQWGQRGRTCVCLRCHLPPLIFGAWSLVCELFLFLAFPGGYIFTHDLLNWSAEIKQKLACESTAL